MKKKRKLKTFNLKISEIITYLETTLEFILLETLFDFPC